LRSLDLFRVKVICFSYEEVANNVVRGLCSKNIAVENDVVVELLVALSLKVVDYRDLWWIVLDHELGRYRWHERATKGKGC